MYTLETFTFSSCSKKYFISVDLVTLDDLSPEAMMESSERVGHLSDIYQRKCEPLSDPGPAGIMPPKIRRANVLTQILGRVYHRIFWSVL